MFQWIKAKFAASDTVDDRLNLAEDARRRGYAEKATEECESVLRVSPQNAQALSLMAAISADKRDFNEGLRWAQRAINVNPKLASAHYAMGRLWEDAENYFQSEVSFRQVTLLDPNHARAYNNLGVALHMQGRLPEALACYRRALQIEPNQPEAMRNFAAIGGGSVDLEIVVEGFQKQIEINPRDAVAYKDLANIYVQLGLHAEAFAHFDRAIALEPDRPDFHFAKAFFLLCLGDYTAGWKEYAWRWQISAFNGPALRFHQPFWDGRVMETGSLLIHGETGFGDTLQFVRFARLAAERCAEVIVECQPALKSLLNGVEGVSRVVAQGEELPFFDAHLPFISCPGVFDTTLESVPWNGPYIKPDAQKVSQWQSLVASTQRNDLKVGLAWASNPGNLGAHARSVPLDLLAPLAQLRGVSFFSLQKGAKADELAAVPAGMSFLDLTMHLQDFSDTAALFTQLNLVLSVDTAVVHLAGAMGLPVWVMLPYQSDWRYSMERSDNPWYPSMRLFRQGYDGDWEGVVKRVVQALAATQANTMPE